MWVSLSSSIASSKPQKGVGPRGVADKRYAL